MNNSKIDEFINETLVTLGDVTNWISTAASSLTSKIAKELDARNPQDKYEDSKDD